MIVIKCSSSIILVKLNLKFPAKKSLALYICLHTNFEFSPLDGPNVFMFQSGLCTSSELETSRGSIRIQHLTGSSHGMESSSSRFPRLEECAHFHYEFAEIGPLQVKPSSHSKYLFIAFCHSRSSFARIPRTRGSPGPTRTASTSTWWPCPLKSRTIGQETSINYSFYPINSIYNFVLVQAVADQENPWRFPVAWPTASHVRVWPALQPAARDPPAREHGPRWQGESPGRIMMGGANNIMGITPHGHVIVP